MLACAAAGCQKAISFPQRSMESIAQAFGAAGAYDTNRDGLADFFTFADGSGRITRVAYGDAGRPGDEIDLDALPLGQCRHLAVILDGFGYEAVKEYQDGGGLRLFHAPSKVIAPYPSMSDPAINDLLGTGPSAGYEAEYFDRSKNRVVGGAGDYLAGKNAPYDRLLDYRASVIDDTFHYLRPRSVYRGELEKLKSAFDSVHKQDFIAYLVSSAGMGTRLGKAGQMECLRELDRLLMQIVWESRGRVKFTLMSDHGHSYTPSTRIPLEKALEAKGWRVADRLEKPRDVVYIRFGLVTYAAFYTNGSSELAKDLAAAEGVELASYADGNAVVVVRRQKQAGHPSRLVQGAVRRSGARLAYDANDGDPLGLGDAMRDLKADDAGFFDANELFAATVDSDYPDAVERVWDAHLGNHALHPPDVIVSLENRFYSGSNTLGGLVKIASTHGSLNRRNSTAFVASTIGLLPPYMRSREVRGNVTAILGRTWAGK
jgi:hypothetical protein